MCPLGFVEMYNSRVCVCGVQILRLTDGWWVEFPSHYYLSFQCVPRELRFIKGGVGGWRLRMSRG